jgi:hypothetical protein
VIVDGADVTHSAVAKRFADSWPGWTYPIAVAVLTVLAIAAAALPPAMVAAFRDPVAATHVP